MGATLPKALTMLQLELPQAWIEPGVPQSRRLLIDAGRIVAKGGEGATSQVLAGMALPGIPNLHSHAFQRAMAGLAERRVAGQDDFWSWRETMYHFAGRVGPDELRVIAAQLYLEMLEQGYTEVCEFHYLHQQPDGRPYADPAAMSLALIEAARDVGIGLTLLPVLYLSGHFDGRPLAERQRRFSLGSVDGFLRLVEALLPHESDRVRIGIALHSLRAVPPEALQSVLQGFADRRFVCPSDPRPIHLHIAEQVGEVADCVALRGARPVQWLLDQVQVDERWCLVHATHLDANEVAGLAASGATVAICPTTEANLGDGLFPLRAYLDAGGRFGIGSDSHVSTSPVEEWRWLEYGQRLQQRSRICAQDSAGRLAEPMLLQSLQAGGRVARPEGGHAWAPGHRADVVMLDSDAPELAVLPTERQIDGWVFNGNRPLVRQVMVSGEWLVSDGRHRARELVQRRYVETCRGLMQD